ncbi:MAG: DUF3971 domain-containing protein [Cohaesibacter sp.]|nr:DUF3971 domain-containing protein [Cohaesibacter sp.]
MVDQESSNEDGRDASKDQPRLSADKTSAQAPDLRKNGDEESIAKEKDKDKAKSGWGRRSLKAVAALVLAVLLVAGLLVLRLVASPLSVPSLVDDIEGAASNILASGQILELDDVQISFAEEGGLALRLSNVKLVEGATSLFSAPRIDLEIDFLSLLQQQFVPSQIYVPRLEAHLVRDQLGRFIIAGQDPGGLSATFGPPIRSQADYYDPDEPEFVSLIYGMRRAMQPLADADLSKRPPRILIRDSELHFTDQLANKTRLLDNVAFSYQPKGDDDNDWRIDFAVDGKKGRIAFAMAEYKLEEETDGIAGKSIEFRFADVSLADIWPRFAEKARRFKFNSPFYGAARMDFDGRDSLIDMQVALDVGAGRLDFGDNDSALLDEASFRLDWEPDDRVLALKFGQVLFGETGGQFKGVAVWPEEQSGDVKMVIEAQDLVLDARDNPNTAKTLNELVLHARVGRQSGIMHIDRFSALAEEGKLDGAGSIALVDDVLTAGMTFQVSPMPYDLLSQMWPVNIAGAARRWVLQNVQSGRTTGGTIEISLTDKMFERTADDRLELPDDAVNGAFGLEHVALKPFGELAPAHNISGTGIFTGRTFLASLTQGELVAKTGQRLPLTSGRFEIPDHAQKPATGILVLEARGSAAALGAVVDHEPLSVLKGEKLSANRLKGQANARIKLRFPFKKDLKKEDVRYDAKVTLSDFSSGSAVRGRDIKAANLAIRTDGTRVDISGSGLIDGLQANVDVETSTDQSVKLKSNVKLVLSDRDRANLGLDLSSWLQGPVSVTIKQNGTSKDRYDVAVDLTKAVLRLDEIGWTKKSGVKGQASFKVDVKGKNYQISSLDVSGQGFKAVGQGKLHAEQGLQSLVISSLSLSRGDSFSVRVAQRKGQIFDISVSGQLLDLRGKLVKGAFASKTASSRKKTSASYHLKARIDRVIGMKGNILSDVSARHSVVRGKDREMFISGKLNGRTDFKVETQTGNNPTLHISTLDAGVLLRFLGIYDKIVGGRLAVSAELAKGWKEIRGSVFLKNFAIKGAARRDASSGQLQRSNTSFDKLTLNFSNKEGIVSVSQGVVKGPVLGATMSGTLDMRQKIVRLTGVYIPAYAVNNLFSRLPVIGRALGNRKNEGLLGITYKIKGAMDNPKVIVNPASMLAPGALRKIFEFGR